MSKQIATISYAKSLGNIKENSDIDNKLIIKNEIRKYNCRIVDNPTVEYQNNQCVKQIDLQKIDDLFATVLIPQITEENSLYMGNNQIGSLVLTATSQPTWIIQKSDPTTGIYFNTNPFISCRSKLYDGITSNAQLYNKGAVSFSANSDIFEHLNYPSGEIALKLTNTITKGQPSLTEIQVKTTVSVYLPFVITFKGNTNSQDNTRMVDFVVTNRTQIHTRFDNNTKYVTYLRTGSDGGVSDTTTYSTFFDYATGEIVQRCITTPMPIPSIPTPIPIPFVGDDDDEELESVTVDDDDELMSILNDDHMKATLGELIIDEGVGNDWKEDLCITGFSKLRRIIVKKNSLKNLDTLTVTQNPRLKYFRAEKGQEKWEKDTDTAYAACEKIKHLTFSGI